jgi:hypothetical protein
MAKAKEKPAVKIDKRIPIPPPKQREGRNVAVLRAMKPGDSVWWPPEQGKFALRFYRVAVRIGVKILIRKVDETDPNGEGVRMWLLDNEE